MLRVTLNFSGIFMSCTQRNAQRKLEPAAWSESVNGCLWERLENTFESHMYLVLFSFPAVTHLTKLKMWNLIFSSFKTFVFLLTLCLFTWYFCFTVGIQENVTWFCWCLQEDCLPWAWQTQPPTCHLGEDHPSPWQQRCCACTVQEKPALSCYWTPSACGEFHW